MRTLADAQALAEQTREVHARHGRSVGVAREGTLAELIALNRLVEKHWVLTSVVVASYGSGLHLDGVNLFDGSTFSWHIDPRYGWNNEFDLSLATVSPEAAALLAKCGVAL